MKKFIALVLVLAMASVASADLLLSVDGMPAPDEITLLAPSGEVTLDIMLMYPQNMTGGQFEIRLSNSQAELLYEPDTFPSNATHWMFDWYTMVKDSSHIEITGGDFGPVTPPADPGYLVILDNVILHCLSETDVIVELHVTGATTINGEVIPVSTVLDSITVHQIPEPATIALLGLGGLTLLRRRRK